MDAKCFDVCVIGAGLYGCAAAYHLSLNLNIKVCLVGPSEPMTLKDHKTRPIASSHYDETRIVRPFVPKDIHVEMTKRSFEGFKQLEKQTGKSIINECGFVYFGPAGDNNYMTACKKASEKMGYHPLILSRDQLRQRFPYIDIGPNHECGLLTSNCGQINPKKLIYAMKSLARLQGCTVFNDIAENIFEQYAPSIGPKTLRVDLDSGQFIQTRKVLLCTGAFTNFKNLLPSHLLLDLLITPLQTIRVELGSEDIHRFHHMPAMSSLGEESKVSDCYICAPVVYPDGKTYLKIGHGIESDGSVETLNEIVRWYKSDGDPKMTELLMTLIRKHFPGLRPLSIQFDTCVDCYSKNGFPYIDMVTRHIGVAVGGNGVGARDSYETGKMAASMIASGHWDHDIPAEHFKACYKRYKQSSKL